MTIEEAQAIADIMDTADSGCDVCARNLRKKAEKKFPQFSWGGQGDKIEAKNDRA